MIYPCTSHPDGPQAKENYPAMIDCANYTEFRRQLVHSSGVYYAAAGRFPDALNGDEASINAYRGNVMAAGYAYALAAAIKLVEQAHGPEAAEGIAAAVEDILTNGDDYNLNDDVTPEPAPTPEGAPNTP